MDRGIVGSPCTGQWTWGFIQVSSNLSATVLRNRVPLLGGFFIDAPDGSREDDGDDDAATNCQLFAASFRPKPKWNSLDLTETRVLPMIFEIVGTLFFVN